jgi:hypothetical protein
MELLLNILWVLIALAALGLWRSVWKKQERHSQHHPLHEWTAFACVLVFLFFAVSLSDDLRASAILADDCGGRRHSLVWASANGSHGHSVFEHASLGVVSAAARVPALRLVGLRMEIPAVPSGTDPDLKFASCRAPPLPFLRIHRLPVRSTAR